MLRICRFALLLTHRAQPPHQSLGWSQVAMALSQHVFYGLWSLTSLTLSPGPKSRRLEEVPSVQYYHSSWASFFVCSCILSNRGIEVTLVYCLQRGPRLLMIPQSSSP